MNDKPLSLNTCQWRLAFLWIAASGILFILMAVQIAGGKYGNEENKAWSWLLPNVLPVLSMIGGAIVYQMNKGSTDITVTPFAYRAAWVVSLLYLILVLTTVLLIPMAESARHMRPIDFLPKTAPVLSGLSVIVSSVLAAFFVSSKPGAAAPAGGH